MYAESVACYPEEAVGVVDLDIVETFSFQELPGGVGPRAAHPGAQ